MGGRPIAHAGPPRKEPAAQNPSTTDVELAAFFVAGTLAPAGFDESLAGTDDAAPAAPDPSTADAEVPESFDDSGPYAPARSDPWMGAGWAVAVLATVVGASLWWSSVLGEDFSGPVNASERWLQVVGWTVAPSLVEGGLIGIVLMLVWAAVRHALRGEEAA